MATTITDGTTTVTPLLVTGWETEAETRNVLHAVLSKSTPDVTLRGGYTRTGTLEMLFTDEADALTAALMHKAAAVFTIASTEITDANYSYVVSGNVKTALDEDTRAQWLVTVEYVGVDS